MSEWVAIIPRGSFTRCYGLFPSHDACMVWVRANQFDVEAVQVHPVVHDEPEDQAAPALHSDPPQEKVLCQICGAAQPCGAHGRTPVTSEDFDDLSRDVAASALPGVSLDIEQAVAHWHTQGGEAQLGDIGQPQNADELIAAILRIVRAALPSAGRQPHQACPCLHTTPCDPRCTCVMPYSSRGCQRCCSYGSKAQQVARAERLAASAGRQELHTPQCASRHCLEPTCRGEYSCAHERPRCDCAGRQEPDAVDTYTPLMWATCSDDEKYEEYIRVRGRLREVEWEPLFVRDLARIIGLPDDATMSAVAEKATADFAAFAALRAVVQQLREYVQHTDECESVKWDGPWRINDTTGRPCTCGLRELVDGPSGH